MTAQVSVVVPCARGHAKVLAECLASLVEQVREHSAELIVVNSHVVKAVSSVADGFGAKTIPGGNGAGASRNIGVSVASGEILAFVDADCVAEPDWLDALLSVLSEGMVIVGGPVLDRFPYHPVAAIDNLMQFIDQSPGRPPGSAREFPGCNLAIRRDAFRDAGGFPEHIFPGEDTVLTQRVTSTAPDQSRFVPAMRVRHRGRTTLADFIRHQADFGRARGRYALNLTKQQQALGRSSVYAALAAGRRILYFLKRTAQWNFPALPKLLLFSPVLIVGLVGWARGFNLGCRTPADGPGAPTSSSR